MKISISKLMFGITAFVIGLLLIGSAFDIITFKDIYPFWTLFIIIPTIGSMISGGINLWKTALLAFGVNCLICQIFWGIWGWRQFLTINLAVIFILLGIFLVFGDIKKNRIINLGREKTPPTQGDGGNSGEDNSNNNYKYNYNYNTNGGAQQNGAGSAGTYSNNSNTTNNGYSRVMFDSNPHSAYTAVFSSKKCGNNCSAFAGASVTAALGSLFLDLSGIALRSDALVNVTSFLGSVDIIVPDNMRVEVNGVEFLGKCSSYAPRSFVENAPCLRIKYTAVCGSVDVKTR